MSFLNGQKGLNGVWDLISTFAFEDSKNTKLGDITGCLGIMFVGYKIVFK